MPALTGLRDVDTSVELGVGLRYTLPGVRFLADIRYGVTGVGGFTGELGADAIVYPLDRLVLTAGPRLSFGDADYMRTWFGVTAAESRASGLGEFRPSAGLKTAGIEANARYQINDRWTVESGASWDRLVGDAGNSPVAAVGTRDQFGFRLGLVRRFTLSFGE